MLPFSQEIGVIVEQTASPSHVFKGKTMSASYGNERVPFKNLSIVAIDKENNLLLIKGAIPGPRNGLVVVRKKEG